MDEDDTLPQTWDEKRFLRELEQIHQCYLSNLTATEAAHQLCTYRQRIEYW